MSLAPDSESSVDPKVDNYRKSLINLRTHQRTPSPATALLTEKLIGTQETLQGRLAAEKSLLEQDMQTASALTGTDNIPVGQNLDQLTPKNLQDAGHTLIHLAKQELAARNIFNFPELPSYFQARSDLSESVIAKIRSNNQDLAEILQEQLLPVIQAGSPDYIDPKNPATFRLRYLSRCAAALVVAAEKPEAVPVVLEIIKRQLEAQIEQKSNSYQTEDIEALPQLRRHLAAIDTYQKSAGSTPQSPA